MQLEINENALKDKKYDGVFTNNNQVIMITPAIKENDWVFRIKLHKDQAILGFWKFTTIGIGFAKEKDWNTNLPFTCEAEKIYNHISHNKKYKKISNTDCLEAIKLIQNMIKHLKLKEEN